MSAKIIDGKAFAEKLQESLLNDIAALLKQGIQPGLAVVLVGDNPASQLYVKNKAKQTIELGMKSFQHVLPAATPEADLLKLIAGLNANDDVDGILVQLPLPPQIDEKKVLAAIDPAKDVDGFHLLNVGKMMTGQDALYPCTPYGCLLLLRDQLGDLTGKNAIVIGRSNIVGKPMAMLLLGENCTVTMAHSKTKDLPALCRQADIVVAAVGKAQMVRGDWIKKGATVIDVGINRIPGVNGKNKVVGDVNFDEVKEVAGAITPVPGGVGPMTIACLLQNTVKAARMRRGIAQKTAANF
ncbi:MAG: bifunctional methylenetetrahydrofolate dehydrogenase/methenyltetrahydrofolate cyclohydrolase FolD [Dongiaceae bacterium]